MSKPAVTLWLLNRVVGWNHQLLVAHLVDRFDVKLGRRSRAARNGAGGMAARIAQCPGEEDLSCVELAVNANEDGASGELMHEGGTLPFGVISQYDEYFVPIPVKCFGDPNSAFWQQCASSTGKERLRELAGHWARRFPEGFQPETAKAEVGPNFGEVRMNLADDRVGYYELLQTATKATQGAQNILIGYSQGGTVARYLAFLDEYVAAPEYRCIHTIITAQSPNRGSPVASRAKSMEVSRALFAVLLSVAKWLPDGFRKQPIWTDLAKHCSNDALLKFVNDLLDAELLTWPDRPENARLRDSWRTARKWLSGLSGVEHLAFWDLDPLRLNEQGSVLDAIARFPLRRIQHGAVIGTDNRLHDFINSLLHDAHWYVRLVACLESNTIERLVKQADDIYKTDVMCFPAGTPAALLGEYQQGLKAKTYGLVADLPAAAHDFVIPSVSQLLIPYDESVHRGNLVNPTASHVSGAVQWNEAEGETDEELALRLLDRIKPVQNAYSRVPGLDVTVA